MSDSATPWTVHSPRNFPGQNTGVGSRSLLQGIFPTQGSNPGLPHFRWILYQLSHQGSQRILEWVVYPFSNRSARPRNWTGISVVGRFFTSWATREAQLQETKHRHDTDPTLNYSQPDTKKYREKSIRCQVLKTSFSLASMAQKGRIRQWNLHLHLIYINKIYFCPL